jgi:endoglucanase
MLGEFGSTLANPLDQQWLTTLLDYLTDNGMSFTYWSWNPNSGDTGGVALDDWYSINQQKYNILQPHLVPPVGGPGPTTPPPTTPPPTTPPPTGGGGCTATYRVVNSWPGGFQGEVTVRAGNAPITGWTVRWTFANGQTISSLWNGSLTTSGSSVAVGNLSYNGSLAANATTAFGFNGTWNNSANTVTSLTCG